MIEEKSYIKFIDYDGFSANLVEVPLWELQNIEDTIDGPDGKSNTKFRLIDGDGEIVAINLINKSEKIEELTLVDQNGNEFTNKNFIEKISSFGNDFSSWEKQGDSIYTLDDSFYHSLVYGDVYSVKFISDPDAFNSARILSNGVIDDVARGDSVKGYFYVRESSGHDSGGFWFGFMCDSDNTYSISSNDMNYGYYLRFDPTDNILKLRKVSSSGLQDLDTVSVDPIYDMWIEVNLHSNKNNNSITASFNPTETSSVHDTSEKTLSGSDGEFSSGEICIGELIEETYFTTANFSVDNIITSYYPKKI